MPRYIIALLCSALCISCQVSESDRLMRELDATLDNQSEYMLAFENHLDSLKARVLVSMSDEERWWLCDTLCYEYILYNIDSASAYADRMSLLAEKTGNVQWKAMSDIARSNILYSRYDYSAAIQLFESIDTTGLSDDVSAKYAAMGIQLYKDILKYQSSDSKQVAHCNERHRSMRELCDRYSDYSQDCRMRIIRWEIDHCNYTRAEGMIQDILDSKLTSPDNICAAYYYLSSAYEGLNMPEESRSALIRAVIHDVKRPILRSYAMLSMSLKLFEEKEYPSALKYMEHTIYAANLCNYRLLQLSAIDAQKAMMQAVRDSEDRRFKMVSALLALVSVLLFLAVALVFYSMSKRRKLARANRVIKSINNSLETVNAELKDSNQIKDNYVSAYMKLSTHYIRQVDVERKELRKIARNDGFDAVQAYLRSPKYADEEYKKFYRFFDDTFLGLFPNFIVKVNELLPPSRHFSRKSDGSLPTEIRILATIRLGITKSQEIADVLNCALRTVYKYRISLRGEALCPKEEFELRIRDIGK